jgi:hypothetical protein
VFPSLIGPPPARYCGPLLRRCAGDHVDQVTRCRVLDRDVTDLVSVPEDDGAGAHVDHLLHVVSDQKDGDALVPHPPDQVEHVARLLRPQRRGRLVHDHDVVAPPRGPAHRYGLPLPPGQAVHRDSHRWHPDAEAVQQCFAFAVHLSVVRPAEPAEWPAAEDLAVEVEVGPHAQRLDQAQVLEDRLDADSTSVVGVVDGGLVAVHLDHARVGSDQTGDALDQRALAGAVVTEQPEDLASAHEERHVVERPHWAEALGQTVDLESGLVGQGGRWLSGDGRHPHSGASTGYVVT